MSETPPRSLEKQAVVAAAHSVTSYEQLAQLGDPEALLTAASVQVSGYIDQYLRNHPFEMLPKTPAQIAAQFRSQESVLILSVNSPATVLYHGAIYPALSPSQVDRLGFQVVEAGSAITHPDYRNGFGLGSLGARLRVTLAQNLSPQTLVISTNKQSLTTRVLEHAGMSPDSFWQYPYLSYLTCTCPNCSEAHGFSACSFRRSPQRSTPAALGAILDRSQPPGKMDCTLVLSSQPLARQFEARCRALHASQGEVPLRPGLITPASMAAARQFFSQL